MSSWFAVPEIVRFGFREDLLPSECINDAAIGCAKIADTHLDVPEPVVYRGDIYSGLRNVTLDVCEARFHGA